MRRGKGLGSRGMIGSSIRGIDADGRDRGQPRTVNESMDMACCCIRALAASAAWALPAKWAPSHAGSPKPMRRRIIWLIVGAPLALVGVAAGATAAVPTLRHIASGLWNVPDRLPQ